MITTILIDDELSALKSLTWELESYCEQVKILDSFTDPEEAISAINYLKPDCIFLDINMPKMDGFTMLSKLNYRNFELIITSAHENYALRAFKENAIDYLLKPIDSDELVKTVSKINKTESETHTEKQIDTLLKSLAKKNHKISINFEGRIIFLTPDEIIYCKSDGNYTTIYCKENSYLVSKNMKQVEELLTHPVFYRTHQSYIVNLQYVKEYYKNDGGYLILQNQESIPVSRNNKKLVLEAIENI